jgi:hypothetical protein
VTSPFTTVSDKPAEDRIYLPVARCKGKLLIVRPIKYQAEGVITIHAPEGTDAVYIDAALLDPIFPAENEEGESLPGFAADTQFRDQMILQGYLKGTFKRYIGQTLIGTVYRGPATKGKPPIMWQDLSADPDCVARGQQFLMTHREFLVPVEAAFAEAVPEVAAGPPAYVASRPSSESVYTQHSPGAGPKTQNTLDQMRAMAAANGPDQDPPF